DLPLELTHAALARVFGHHAFDGLVGELDVLALESRLLELTRNEIALRDLALLLLRVPGELHDLHAVEQRSGNVLHEVTGADEEDLTEIERNAEVVIGEGVILRGIEHLEQRARGIALE